jgi:hypothetical protein
MRDAAFEIVSRFPPSRYVYVPVGSSPAPMSALLRHLSPADVFDLPVSGLRKAKFRDSQTALETRLDEGGREALQSRFRGFLPSERLRAGRSILLIDYVSTGDTLNLLRRELLMAYQERGVRVEAVGLGTPGPSKQPWLHSLKSLETNREIEERFRAHAYRSVALRDTGPFWEPVPKRKGGHFAYQREMAQQLLAEPEFRNALAGADLAGAPETTGD